MIFILKVMNYFILTILLKIRIKTMKYLHIVFLILLFTASNMFSQSGDTITTGSGLKYVVVEKKNGIKAEPGKYVEVHYILYVNGKQIETSRNGEPFDFTIGKGMVIKGWDEGIALMNVGDKLMLIIPPELGYGEKGAGDLIPPNSTLVFDVELMSVSEPKKSLIDLILPLCVEGKTDEAIKKYYEVKNSPQKNEYNFRESQLSFVAYKLMRLSKFNEALEIMKLDIKEYPESSNAFDTMGEVYLRLGNYDKAINSYEKSLALNPKNTNAKDYLKNIREKNGYSTILKEKYFDKDGYPLTGKGVVVGDIDSGVDIFHPMFFFADGGDFGWIDVNGNGNFDAGIDVVDFDGTGVAKNNCKLNYIKITDNTKFLSSDTSIFQPDLDFLYIDKNENSKRDFGEKDGFTEQDATYGEQFFIVRDANRNNKLDVGEKITALKTSKVRAIREKNGTVRRRGVDLIKAEPDESGHGTGVCGIILGGHYGVQKIHGLAPDAEIVVANIPYNYEPRFVRVFPDLIKFLRSENINVLLFEDGEWMWEYMDGSTEEEQLVNKLTEDGITVIAASGNLAKGKMHIKDTLKSGDNKKYNFTVIEKQGNKSVDGAFISILWKGEEKNINFTLTMPDGKKTPELQDGTDFITCGEYEIYYAKEISPRKTVMFKIGIKKRNGEIVGGNYVLEAKTNNDVIIDGYLVDVTQGWGNISKWVSDKICESTTVTFPATADSVISVGAYVVYKGWGGDVGDLANYSSWGYNISGKLGVDITAPSHTTFSTGKNLSYIIFSGTSAAAPHVVGTAALLLQYDKLLTHSQVKNILKHTAIKDDYTGAVPNPKWGWGKLNPEGAIRFLIFGI